VDAVAVIWRGQTRTIEEGVEAWKAEYGRAQAAHVLDLLVQPALLVNRITLSRQEELWRRLRAGDRSFPSQRAGREMLEEFERTLHVLGLLEGSIAQAERDGYEVEGAADLRLSHQEVQKAQAEFRDRWPLLDPAEVSADMEAIARGEFFSLDDARRELDSPDRP
jgi:hypothetical protein